MYQSCTFVKAFSSGSHGDYVKWGRGTGMNFSAAASNSPARLVLVGVRGFGQVHAERITRLSNQGLVELVAAVDPGVVLDPPIVYGVDLYADLAEALSAVGPVDVVVIAAPLGEHFRLATIALNAGADVYLEKPPVASLEDFESLLQAEQKAGRVVQVGFQSLGSRALEMLREDAFDIIILDRASTCQGSHQLADHGFLVVGDQVGPNRGLANKVGKFHLSLLSASRARGSGAQARALL